MSSKCMVAGKARWEYCGSYEATNVGNIEAEMFEGFPRNVCEGNQSVRRVLMYNIGADTVGGLNEG